MRGRSSPFIILILSMILPLVTAGCRGQESEPAEVEQVTRVLELQKDAWNRGDLEGYMVYYWRSDQLTFQSGANRVRGWETLLERYKKGYSGDRMGQLDFSDLEVKPLGRDFALVLGRWSVDIQGEKKGGVFTLVMKKFPEGWRIIHDHTS